VKNINIDLIFVNSYNHYIHYLTYSAKLYYIQITKLTSFHCLLCLYHRMISVCGLELCLDMHIGLHNKCPFFVPFLTKIEMTWLFFVKFGYVGHKEIYSKLYPQNISPLIYTIGENRHKLCL